jgi:hypothetical protein
VASATTSQPTLPLNGNEFRTETPAPGVGVPPPPPSTRVPAGQLTETPWEPAVDELVFVTMVKPLIPGPPCAPVSPLGPRSPFSPLSPFGPCGPAGPASPFSFARSAAAKSTSFSAPSLTFSELTAPVWSCGADAAPRQRVDRGDARPAERDEQRETGDDE